MLDMPFLDGIRVIRSNIHGYGGLTTRTFAKGDILCHGDGVVYPDDVEFDDTYALVLQPEDSGLATPMFFDLVCQTRWFNHSCDPNTEVMLEWNRETETMTAWWVALRDIPIGVEVTYDYAFAAEVAEACFCGAPTCRGVIVDPDPENLARLSEPLRAQLR